MDAFAVRFSSVNELVALCKHINLEIDDGGAEYMFNITGERYIIFINGKAGYFSERNDVFKDISFMQLYLMGDRVKFK